ncbi:prepilin-type N-terminal cleavage/methylation domain-containing protein [Candidatus Peregrinibacteria bacterium]|nr:prepilin-type N-terminal cleavage/methylation domain-containing protein [Candidatus Peregrinibacteria bacterium]
MKKNSKSRLNSNFRAGFTLLELLIVIMIMAMMTVVAVNAFSLVQKEMKVDFAADTLVATIKEAQVLAKSGRRAVASDGTTGPALCYLVKIGAASESGLWTASSDYIAVSEASDSGGVPVVDSCTTLSESQMLNKDIFSDKVKIKAILQDGSDADNQQLFYLKPPFGQMYVWEDSVLKPLASGKFQYLIGYDQESTYDKKVEFDLATGEIKKL